MRTWRLAYEIDIDADTAEDAARKATHYARNTNGIATWAVISTESSMGEPMAEITGLVHMMPDGTVELELNQEVPIDDSN